ncbi:hypothetical protein MHUMG1_08274 [Metarhizium humberi]|uniref:Uncharacterized protein n=1 Tax=Metarhizium humberi TaxID=2596975 RepID=A0A9P8M3U4_9HYPO|nr:hypothetical protein MHUMG1_08274 [Metarhizium humberi]
MHGRNLLNLVRSGHSPFEGVWDVGRLSREIGGIIPIITKGPNNNCFHVKTSNMPDMAARLARGHVNMPDFDGLTIEIQAEEVCFEVAVYNFLRWETEILASRLLYPCVLVQYQGPILVIPRDLGGRQLFVYESSEGENDVWTDLTLLISSYFLATVWNEGDMIGWEEDEETVGHIALAARQSHLRAVPPILHLAFTT